MAGVHVDTDVMAARIASIGSAWVVEGAIGMCVGFVNASSCNHVAVCEQNTADTDFKTSWQQTQGYRKGRSMRMSRREEELLKQSGVSSR